MLGFLLWACAGSEAPVETQGEASPPRERAPRVTVLYTHNVDGEIEPCG
jgi:hypothetical protein